MVVCADEASQVQADPTAPIVPLRPDMPAKATHDYVRHLDQDGTTILFTALAMATGKVVDRCYHRHRHEEFLAFLKVVAPAVVLSRGSLV